MKPRKKQKKLRITEADFLLANRRAARLEEIELHGKSAAQVALRFLTQQGIIVIPKSVHKERMIQNLETLDFDLSQEEMAAIRSLDTGHNLEGWPSDALKYNPNTV